MEVYFIIFIVLFAVAIFGNAVVCCCCKKSAIKSESKLIERFFVVKEEIRTPRDRIIVCNYPKVVIYYTNEVSTPLLNKNLPKNTINYTSERRDRLSANSQCSRI